MQTEKICRLCATPKEPDELRCTIDDATENIEGKLIVCCDWNSYRSHTNLPNNVCRSCYLLLEQCWNFRQTVSRAQHKLNARMVLADKDGQEQAEGFVEIKVELIVPETPATYKGECSNANATTGLDKNIGRDMTNETEKVWCGGSDYGNDDDDDDDDDDDNGAGDHESDDSSDDNTELHKEEPLLIEAIDSAHTKKTPSKQPVKTVVNPSHYRKIGPGTMKLTPAYISKLLTRRDLNEDGSINADKTLQLNLTNWQAITMECSICKNFTDDHVKLQKHYDDVHPSTRLELYCAYCVKTERYLTGRYYRYHIIKEHFPHLALCCYRCQIFFATAKQLQQHLRSHPKDPTRNVCPHCGKYFAWSKNLFIHMIGHMPDNERPLFECYLCKNRFRSRGSMQKHMKLHIGVKKTSICDQCGKAFVNPSKLKKHMITHSTVRSFICEQCSKMFKTQSDLNRHHRNHDTMKQYACEKCDYRAADRTRMRSHMERLHPDAPMFPCKDCDKRFFSMRTLKMHQESHLKSSMFQCELCDIATTTKSSMTRHHKQVHLGWKPHACTTCDFHTFSATNLRMHIQKLHGNK